MNTVELMLRVDGRAILLGQAPTEPNCDAESYREPIADLLFKCAAPAVVQDAATRTWKRINRRRRPKRGGDVPGQMHLFEHSERNKGAESQMPTEAS